MELANGVVAYLTAWYQKGQVIYFINILGYLLFGSKVGVWFLQVVSLLLWWKCYREDP